MGERVTQGKVGHVHFKGGASGGGRGFSTLGVGELIPVQQEVAARD